MKKILFPVLMLIASFSVNAQWSSMAITNHSSCDYNVHLFATYDVYGSCNYENQTICVRAGATVSAPTYWDWGCFNPFVTGPAVPEAPTTWGLSTCGGIGSTAAPWGVPPTCFDWRGALIWPCGFTPGPPNTNIGSPCGVTHYVGDGFCGPQNPMPPTHIWTENPATGNVTLDLY